MTIFFVNAPSVSAWLALDGNDGMWTDGAVEYVVMILVHYTDEGVAGIIVVSDMKVLAWCE